MGPAEWLSGQFPKMAGMTTGEKMGMLGMSGGGAGAAQAAMQYGMGGYQDMSQYAQAMPMQGLMGSIQNANNINMAQRPDLVPQVNAMGQYQSGLMAPPAYNPWQQGLMEY